MFVDFTSASNTIVPNILLDRLKTCGVPFYLRSVIKSFLVNRQQFIQIGEDKSLVLNCDTGCPQGCVLSPVLFSIYTEFIGAAHTDIKTFKYADDMVVVGLLNIKDSDTLYPFFDVIQTLLEQCASVSLLINASKTKGMVMNFSKSCVVYDYIFINGRSSVFPLSST